MALSILVTSPTFTKAFDDDGDSDPMNTDTDNDGTSDAQDPTPRGGNSTQQGMGTPGYPSGEYPTAPYYPPAATPMAIPQPAPMVMPQTAATNARKPSTSKNPSFCIF